MAVDRVLHEGQPRVRQGLGVVEIRDAHPVGLDADVVALTGDLRFGDTEGVDALADDGDGLIDGLERGRDEREPHGHQDEDVAGVDAPQEGRCYQHQHLTGELKDGGKAADAAALLGGGHVRQQGEVGVDAVGERAHHAREQQGGGEDDL